MTVTQVEVASALVALLVVTLAGLTFAWRDLVRVGDRQIHAGLLAAILAGVALAVLGGKLWTLRMFGTDLPFWDQWDAEPALYLGFQNGTLTWAQMAAPHNEHRILISWLFLLGLELVNGQWDARLQMVADALLHVTAVVALLAVVAPVRRRIDLACAAAVVALVAGLPFGWENVLWGFQSPFYFELLFAVLAIGLGLGAPLRPLPGVLSFLCAACAVLSLGSGALAPLTIAGVLVAGAIRTGRPWSRTLAAAAPFVALGVLGVAMAGYVPAHAALRAQGAGSLLKAFGRAAAWPFVNAPWWAPVLWAPWIAFTVRHFRGASDRPRERALIGLGAWTLLHALAMAFVRGADGAPPATRYMDLLAVGLVVNAVALLALLAPPAEVSGTASAWRRATWGLACAWTAVAISGGVWLARRDFRQDLPQVAGYRRYHVTLVRRFLETDDPAVLADASHGIPPYPIAEHLAGVLRQPFIRQILPASVRQPPWIAPLGEVAQRLVKRGLAFMGLGLGVWAAGFGLAARARLRPASAPPPGTASRAAPS
jgi:hypothetical protein